MMKKKSNKKFKFEQTKQSKLKTSKHKAKIDKKALRKKQKEILHKEKKKGTLGKFFAMMHEKLDVPIEVQQEAERKIHEPKHRRERRKNKKEIKAKLKKERKEKAKEQKKSKIIKEKKEVETEIISEPKIEKKEERNIKEILEEMSKMQLTEPEDTYEEDEYDNEALQYFTKRLDKAAEQWQQTGMTGIEHLEAPVGFKGKVSQVFSGMKKLEEKTKDKIKEYKVKRKHKTKLKKQPVKKQVLIKKAVEEEHDAPEIAHVFRPVKKKERKKIHIKLPNLKEKAEAIGGKIKFKLPDVHLKEKSKKLFSKIYKSKEEKAKEEKIKEAHRRKVIEKMLAKKKAQEDAEKETKKVKKFSRPLKKPKQKAREDIEKIYKQL